MNGITGIRALRKINSKVPIIAVSRLPAYKESAFAAGTKIFLEKPYTLEEPLQTVHMLLVTTQVEEREG